jgi:hypothetical protein
MTIIPPPLADAPFYSAETSRGSEALLNWPEAFGRVSLRRSKMQEIAVMKIRIEYCVP